MTIQDLKNNGSIVYEHYRGSYTQGTYIEGKSDMDMGGVYIAPPSILYGLPCKYTEQVSDSKGDTVYYELGRWVELLMKSNPTALESLFVDKKFIIGNVHPSVQHIIDNRDLFLSKECFRTLNGYATSQIQKARGLNKKFMKPIETRKEAIDFCYIVKGNGSMSLEDFLKEQHLEESRCAVSNINNMPGVYNLYYDFNDNLNFRGIFKRDCGSTMIRFSNIPKGIDPILQFSYNESAFSEHCKQYKEYQEWVEKRNPQRYSDNKGHEFDGKNLAHCLRLIYTGIDLADGNGFIVERPEREYLLAVKTHQYSYDEIMDNVLKQREILKEKEQTCTLPDKPDVDAINNILIESREIYYKDKGLII